MKKQIQLKGFTLIELLVVVLIIGILTSIAVPQYQKSVAKARYVEIQTLVEQLNDAEEMYAQEYGYYTNDFTKLKDFSVPGWTPSKTSLEGRTRDVATYLRKNDEKAELSLDTLLAGTGGRAITGTIFSGKHSNGNAIWANRYVLYAPHGGWRENQRECRARASDADKNKPKNTNNHVCDSVGGIRCQWNSSNGNIFIIETLAAIQDGGSTSTMLNNICAPYKNNGGITTGYYKANKTWYQTYVGPQ